MLILYSNNSFKYCVKRKCMHVRFIYFFSIFLMKISPLKFFFSYTLPLPLAFPSLLIFPSREGFSFTFYFPGFSWFSIHFNSHQCILPAPRLEKLLLPPSCFLTMFYLVRFLDSDSTVSAHMSFLTLLLHVFSSRHHPLSSSHKDLLPRLYVPNPNAQSLRSREIPPPPPITPQSYIHHMQRV